MPAATRTWTDEERDLWRRLEAHAFETSAIELDFTGRLARTLGWDRETARGAIGEYRRFCFLACVGRGPPVTPSEEVDEVWHLHLTYSRDYWDRWCAVALRRELHHDPTAGGADEASKYRMQYAETLALYESYFGPPPVAFWPGTNQRFGARPRYRVVDTARATIMPRLTQGRWARW